MYNIFDYGFINEMNRDNKSGTTARITSVHKGRFGIVAVESVQLPAPECLMVKELVENALENVSGVYEYTDYKSLA